jgi:hypothetical protein
VTGQDRIGERTWTGQERTGQDRTGQDRTGDRTGRREGKAESRQADILTKITNLFIIWSLLHM